MDQILCKRDIDINYSAKTNKNGDYYNMQKNTLIQKIGEKKI